MKIKDMIRGYKYTSRTFIRYGNYQELKRIAKSENKFLKKCHRIERMAVYPVPGSLGGMGQLVVLY